MALEHTKQTANHAQHDRFNLTCIRLLFRTDTDDLTGGVRRGKGAMVISHTCFVLKEGPAGWGGPPTTAAELPTPPRPLELQGPTARCCVKQHAG
mgnify:CR=1 FL=1